MNLVLGVFFAIILDLALDRITELFYCKKNYKKKSNCKCWTCRFYKECEFTNEFKKRSDNNE